MVAADRLMAARISAQHERWDRIAEPGRQEELAKVLGRIPVDAPIEDSTFDGDVDDAVEILTRGGGVQLAIATKLLCIKRPHLIPMMDSMVQYCFDCTKASEILKEFRRLLAERAFSESLGELAKHIGSSFGVTPSRVRILDELIWFDWNLGLPEAGWCKVRGFDDWGYDVENDDRGIYYCPERRG